MSTIKCGIIESDPYSPFLNSIENLFSVLKADLKQRLSYVQERLDGRAAGLAAGYRSCGMVQCIATWRSSILEDMAHEGLSAIAQERVCAACRRHANSFLGREDILVDGERIPQQTSPLNILFCSRHAEAIQVLMLMHAPFLSR